MKKAMVSMLLFLMSVLSFSAGASLTIKRVDITNNREVPVNVIKNKMDLEEGKPFSTDLMLHDFQALKGLKYLDEVLIQPSAYEDGVQVTVHVVETPNVQALLQEDGIISISQQANMDKSVIITKVEMEGNQLIPTEKLLKMLPLHDGSYYSSLGIEQGKEALLNSGYFKSVDVDVDKTEAGVQLRYDVVENPVVQGVEFFGNTVFPSEVLAGVVQTKAGEILNINTVRADRDRIMNLYQDAGFTLSEILEMGINEKGDLDIVIAEGVVRSVTYQKMVTKQKGHRRKPTDDVLKTQDYVIQREIELKTGSVYNAKAYDQTVQNLMRLGVFKNIKSEIRRVPGDPNGRAIVLLIDEDRTAILQAAISYGSETGMMGTLSLKDHNWKGKTQEFGVSLEKSNKDYTGFTVDFFDPWIKDTNRISWGWSAYRTSYGDSDSALFQDIETLGLRANVGKGFKRHWRFSLGTKVESIKETAENGAFNYYPGHGWVYDGVAQNKKGEEAQKTGPYILPKDAVNDKYMIFSVYPYLTYDTRNNPWNATSGEYAKFQIETGYAGGYQSGSFSNASLELRKYHRGLFKKNTFAYRFIGGIMTDSTKEAQRYWLGGGNTLRGYDGGTFRGTKKMVGTIENRTQFNDVIGLVFFADAGRAWDQNGRDPKYGNDFQNFPNGVATTAGVGIRLNTPMGPLRFDFGWPVGKYQGVTGNGIQEDKGMKFYFNMGQSF